MFVAASCIAGIQNKFRFRIVPRCFEKVCYWHFIGSIKVLDSCYFPLAPHDLYYAIINLGKNVLASS